MSDPPPKSPAKSFVVHAQIIGILTLFSRVLGMARESVAAGVFGAGLAWSAFTVAFTIPNLFRKLFGEGALSAAFIPLYAAAVREEQAVGSGPWAGGAAEKKGSLLIIDSDFVRGKIDFSPKKSGQATDEKISSDPFLSAAEGGQFGGGKISSDPILSDPFLSLPNTHRPLPTTASANDFAAASVSLLTVILVGLTLVGEALLGAFVWLTDLRPDQLLTLKLTAIMLPYVLLICGTAFLSGILQVHKKFALPAFAPVLLNVIHIGVMVVGAWLLQLRATTNQAETIAKQTTLVYWLAGFVLVAGVLQIAMLLPALFQTGFRFKLFGNFWTPPVKKMLLMSVPVALSAGVLQCSVLIDKALSVFLSQGVDAVGNTITYFTFFGHEYLYPMQAGAVARLGWAQFLYQFPLGIFAIALATAIFPTLSAEALNKDRTQFRKSLNQGIEATLFEGIAASVGLILVARPCIRLLFEHGSFTPADTELVYRSTVFYAAGIWAFSLQQILNRAYYALHDTKTPLYMSVIVLIVNTVVEIPLVFIPALGEAGMAAGTLVSFSLQVLWMLYMLDHRVGGLGLGALARKSMKMIVAAALMTWACVSVQKLSFYPTGTSNAASFMQLVVLMGLGATVYLVACALLGLEIVRNIRPRRKRAG